MSEVAWVLGAGGLLGSALVRALERQGVALHRPALRWPWNDPDRLAQQISCEVALFAERAALASHWSVYWAAGIGVMGSDADVLAREAQAQAALLNALGKHPVLAARPGSLALASSAGALYGAGESELVSETSVVAPGTPYAEHKLATEAQLRAATAAHPLWSGLIARYSTLYGAGQSRGKAQGLISQMARRIVANEVVHVYVPLDTIRDYLHADDAADRTLAALHGARAAAGNCTVKIIAAEQATTIAQLIGVFRRVSRRPVRLVTSVNRLSPLYRRCIQFRSDEPVGQPHAPARSLHIGIHQVLEAERQAAFSGQRSAA